jgi:oligoendopeptidase F
MEYPLEHLVWDTTRLYSSPQAEELDRDIASATALAGTFRATHFGKVAALDADGLLQTLIEFELLQELIAKPQLYAYLLFAADSENDTHKKLSQQTAEFGNKMARELLFFDLELIELPDDRYATLLNDARLIKYRHFLESLRKFRPHTLPEREERLLKQKSLTGADAFCRLFDELSASFRYRMEMDGEEQDFTGEELLGMLHHPEAAVRERAFGTFLKRHQDDAITFTTIFNTIALDHSQELEMRNYQAPMEPTHLANELSTAAVAKMMAVTEDNYPLAQEYFRLKARLLKIPKLKNSDIYAPLAETHRQYTFKEASDLVLNAYGDFDGECRDIIAAFYTDRRLDVMPRHGKSGGAFCMGMTPHLPPYVLLNFTGNLRDAATLAHELGHGLHFVLAQRQSSLNYHPPLPLAETASVFGEMLLTRFMLERETDPAVKISLLCAKIEDIIATTFRQNVLTRFEERMHLERSNGLLVSSQLCDAWWQENAKLYGDSVEMIEPYRWGWSYISHFIHARFYCYSYTFAELLVLSLFSKYLQTGPAFIPDYKAILASGGSLSPADTVKQAGIDFADPGFWQQGYDFLGDLIDELKGLV